MNNRSIFDEEKTEAVTKSLKQILSQATSIQSGMLWKRDLNAINKNRITAEGHIAALFSAWKKQGTFPQTLQELEAHINSEFRALQFMKVGVNKVEVLGVLFDISVKVTGMIQIFGVPFAAEGRH